MSHDPLCPFPTVDSKTGRRQHDPAIDFCALIAAARAGERETNTPLDLALYRRAILDNLRVDVQALPTYRSVDNEGSAYAWAPSRTVLAEAVLALIEEAAR